MEIVARLRPTLALDNTQIVAIEKDDLMIIAVAIDQIIENGADNDDFQSRKRQRHPCTSTQKPKPR